MPQLVTISYPLSQIIDHFDPPQNRKAGWHVTDLIKASEEISKGHNVPNGGFEWVGDDSGMMALGRMWEGAVRNWLGSYCENMGLKFSPSIEVSEEEIIANLDGLADRYPDPAAVIEIKCTTGNPNPLDKPHWIQQVKAYCHMVQVNQVWFVVLHLPRRGAPEAKVYLHMIDFEDWEIEENWRMIVSTKEYLESRGVRLWDYST